MFDDRDRRIAQGSLAIDLFRGVTVTPTFSAKDDDYRLDPTKEVGLRYYKSVSAGVELAWLITPGTRFLVSYTKDRRNQLITSAGGNVAPFPATAYYNAEVADLVHTYIAGVTWEAIPSALDVAVTYSYVSTSNTQPLIFMNGTVPSLATGGQYPDVRSDYQRLEATAKYTFDEGFVRQMGLSGKMIARVRYAWEHNRVQNWQTDVMQSYMYSPILTSVGYMTWMAWDNPNYNVHILGGSLAFAW